MDLMKVSGRQLCTNPSEPWLDWNKNPENPRRWLFFLKKEGANRNNRYVGVVEENSKYVLGEWVRELKERHLGIKKHA